MSKRAKMLGIVLVGAGFAGGLAGCDDRMQSQQLGDGADETKESAEMLNSGAPPAYSDEMPAGHQEMPADQEMPAGQEAQGATTDDAAPAGADAADAAKDGARP